MSPLSAVFLNLPPHDIMQFDFTQLLEQGEKDLLSSGEELIDFQLQSRLRLKARQTAVRDPAGKLVLRLIMLSETV